MDTENILQTAIADPFHHARNLVRRLGEPALSIRQATVALRRFASLAGVPEGEVAKSLIHQANTGAESPFTPSLKQFVFEQQWTEEKPTKAGTFLWRKDCKWEPVFREVLLRERDGQLVTYSHRFENYVPLSHLDAGGSLWLQKIGGVE